MQTRLSNIQGQLAVKIKVLDKTLVGRILARTADAVIARKVGLAVNEQVVLDVAKQLVHLPDARTVPIAYDKFEFAEAESLQRVGILSEVEEALRYEIGAYLVAELVAIVFVGLC